MLINQIRKRINSAKQILVISHIRPDGDAVGSVLALGLSLEQAGKSVQMVLVDGVPEALRYIQSSDKIMNKVEGLFDLAIALDASDVGRLGFELNDYGPPDINIDHHFTNTGFAKFNLAKSEAAATTEILADFLPELGFEISPLIASALLTGIITDTIGFRVNSVTPHTLRISARLMELGGDLATLYRQSLLLRSVHAIRYWGAGLADLQVDGQMVWTTLSLVDRQRANYPGRDDADLINVLSGISPPTARVFTSPPTSAANSRRCATWSSQAAGSRR